MCIRDRSKDATAAEAIPLPSDEATPPVINTYCITDNPDTELNNLYQDNNISYFQELQVLEIFLLQN